MLVLRCVVLGMPALFLSACVTSSKTKMNAAGVEVTIPDPDGDKDVPKFCNPTGKKGADLKACYEHNETIYRTFDDEAKAREPWFNFAPDSWVESVELDSRLILSVAKEQEAAKKLEVSPVVELTPAEVEYFSGLKTAVPGYAPYLVRGLFYFKETGTYSVFEKSGAILVRHDSIGATTPKENRSGIIVFLKQKPSTVYVDCQVTE